MKKISTAGSLKKIGFEPIMALLVTSQPLPRQPPLSFIALTASQNAGSVQIKVESTSDQACKLNKAVKTKQ